MNKKTLFLGLFVITFSFLPLASVKAEDNEITEEKISNVETNCHSIKETLKRVQNSDRNSRVSIGRYYQTALTDFITPLNVRLVKSNLFNAELADIQTNYASARETFNRDYISYSQSLEELLSKNCVSDPEGFYLKLEETREKRVKVAESSAKVQEILNQHINSVNSLYESFKSGEE